MDNNHVLVYNRSLATIIIFKYISKALQCLFVFFFFFYVRAYLGINSKKLITNGKDHIVTADKYTPR